MVLSFDRQIEVLFGHWLENVERLLGRHVDREAAYKAWRDGYSIREFATEMTALSLLKGGGDKTG
jgi:hypothetical protein